MQENPTNTSEPKKFGPVVLGLYRAIETMPPGDRAQLRRLRPGELEPPAFWRLVTGVLAPEFHSLGQSATEARERSWGLIAAAMARTGMNFDSKRKLGKAMADSGISEVRLLRLLRADSGQLPAQAHSVAQLLASKGQAIHWIDFALLILSQGRSDQERARRQIARDYFSNTTKN